MRTCFLSIVLGVTTMSLVSLAPSAAQARRPKHRRPAVLKSRSYANTRVYRGSGYPRYGRIGTPRYARPYVPAYRSRAFPSRSVSTTTTYYSDPGPVYFDFSRSSDSFQWRP